MKHLFRKIVSMILTVGIVAAVGAFFAPTAMAFSNIDDFEKKVYTDKNHRGKQMPYRLYLPSDYDESKSYPLVVYLHGVGERGDDNYAPISWNTSPARKLAEPEYQKKYPCIIVVPQCPADDYWCWDFPNDITPANDMMISLCKSLASTYHVDQNRMYLTGFSNGGTGIWDALIRYPDMFAAAVPMSGYTAPWAWNQASKIKDIPLQVYHCNQDPIVKVYCSQEMVDALKAAGSKVQYHEIDSGDHGFSVTSAYYDDQLLPWLFSQKNHNTFPPFVPQGIKGKDFLSSSSKTVKQQSSKAAPVSSKEPVASKTAAAGASSSANASSQTHARTESAVSSEEPAQSVGNIASAAEQKTGSSVSLLMLVVSVVVVGIIVAGGVTLLVIIIMKKK